MKRMIIVLTVAALMAVMLVVGAGSAFAVAYNEVSGGPSQAEINDEAGENCEENVMKQTEEDVAAGGGPKQDIDAPTNCDHFYQREGNIGDNDQE
jgi:hypothetical protein